ncbi:MAG: Phosphoenolpyruvate-protein phosphotransferase of system [Haloplasmataceae bacterium]|jgi:phosphotransferase system enzyme I (PtsI)|nr:Phosphoenolpyruvate-protein phosphotransferase of system [Haloplasmataceae bacterium]
MIKGEIGSKGIAFAKAYILEKDAINVLQRKMNNVEKEKQRFIQAIEATKEEILNIKNKLSKNLEEAIIFDSHLLIIEDPDMIAQVFTLIEINKVNVEYAFKTVIQLYINLFKNMDNEYMKERISDIEDVFTRLLSKLLNVNLNESINLDSEVIIIAHDLTPSDTAQLDKMYVKGFITDIGGKTSHSVIMARSLEIPCIVGTQNITNLVKSGDFIILDGINGAVYINPSDELIEEYKSNKIKYEKENLELLRLKDLKTKTLDHFEVKLGANIGSLDDIQKVLNNGAESIGLFRTEFIYMDRFELPNEEEQYSAYKKVLESMENRPVIIRTLDIGGDKELSYLKLPHEANPFLGYRAIRMCLDRINLFKTQLRAILRASVHGNLKVMFPMIATLTEFIVSKQFLLLTKEELINEGYQISDHIEIGMMVEVPAAALLADVFAKHVDFFSIGTNDLIQYTFAADRMNENVSYLNQPFNPSLLRLIKHVVDSAHKENKWVSMCGEMAGDHLAIPVLIGLGLDEFSMNAASILPSRLQISNLNKTELHKIANEALTKGTAEEVIELLRKCNL